MKKPFPLFLPNITNLSALLAIFLTLVVGCANGHKSSQRSETPSASPSGRIAANNAVKDPKARYLGQALAYVNNLVVTDKAMVEEFQNDSSTPQSIVASIKTAHETEIRDYKSIESPPKAYSSIASKLAKIHKDHDIAYTAYLQTFTQPDRRRMEKSIDRGNDVLKRSMLKEMTEVKDLIMAATERDVNTAR